MLTTVNVVLVIVIMVKGVFALNDKFHPRTWLMGLDACAQVAYRPYRLMVWDVLVLHVLFL
jgi:hypothetical protein